VGFQIFQILHMQYECVHSVIYSVHITALYTYSVCSVNVSIYILANIRIYNAYTFSLWLGLGLGSLKKKSKLKESDLWDLKKKKKKKFFIYGMYVMYVCK
jgi:hypothetical protein